MAKKTRVLLAEDDRDHQQLLHRALTKSCDSMVLTVVGSKDELLGALREQSFDCLVLDYNLGSNTAPEVLGEACGLVGNASVVVVSSSEEQAVVIESMRKGVADFVPKEVALFGDTLWRVVDAAVRSRRRELCAARQSDRRMRSMQREIEADPLTGLGNRRLVNRFLNHTRLRGDRRGDVGIVMIDIDHFKSINDTYGHDAGDAALRAIARIIRDHARSDDVVARWGGEEFVVLRFGCDIVSAWAWAERTRELIRNTRFELGKDRRQITVSVGVHCLPIDRMGEDSVGQADLALYAAKDYGRDRSLTWGMAHTLEIAEAVSVEPVDLESRIRSLYQRLGIELGSTHRRYAIDHGTEVERIARTLASGAARVAQNSVALAAKFHDIGKICIPEELLDKPGRLTDDERRFVSQHARLGAEILRAIGAPEDVANLVEQHHCFFADTTPSQTESESLAHGLVTVADAAAAMLSGRPYAMRKTMRQVVDELNRCRGSQFDPDAVDLFCQLHACV